MIDNAKQVSALTRVNSPTNITKNSPPVGEKFLRFQLGEEGIGLLPLNVIKQVMQVSVAEILTVPQMPACVLGIYNWRGEMLWMVDIGKFMGFPNLATGGLENLMAIAIQVEDQYLGLIVQQINDIELHDLNQVNMPSLGLFSPEILPYLEGYLIGADKEVLMVLNGEAIAQAPLWQLNR
ncbi:chemotaxis protein CheW [Aerosakkonemataceae cyanobacterium BLCC-F154]|uniref:Chemotaxis protein CheW n=1 Tax=Floridaenema fluviatile BLCC-F154 TaxID=3153640 RepID=A0ABV4YAM6_9CYAN